jgi:hypothetical protein
MSAATKHTTRGALSHLAGDRDAARSEYEAALAADPGFAHATRALRELPSEAPK